jgi:hypothetical protein
MTAVAEGKPIFASSGFGNLVEPLMRHIAKPAAETTLFSAEAVANGQRLGGMFLGRNFTTEGGLSLLPITFLGWRKLNLTCAISHRSLM